MLKTVLLECAKMLDRFDIVESLEGASVVADIKDKQIQHDVMNLISCYNLIMNIVCDEYCDLIREDCFISDSNGKIYFSNFMFKPLKIIGASTGNIKEYFQVFVDYIVVLKRNSKYPIEYKYSVDELKDLDALSATVETVISAQSQINLAFADSISGLSDDVEALKEADAQFAEQLSAMTEDINEVTSGLSDAMCGIQILGKEIDDLKDTL